MSKRTKTAGLTAIDTGSVTADGYRAPFKREAAPTSPQVGEPLQIPIRTSSMREPYTGAELRPTYRRGAQDAFRLPSNTFYGVRQPEPAEA